MNLATETDIERLRQAAMLLEQENARLFRRIETLVAELAEARGEDARSLQLEIECLKQQCEHERCQNTEQSKAFQMAHSLMGRWL